MSQPLRHAGAVAGVGIGAELLMGTGGEQTIGPNTLLILYICDKEYIFMILHTRYAVHVEALTGDHRMYVVIMYVRRGLGPPAGTNGGMSKIHAKGNRGYKNGKRGLSILLLPRHLRERLGAVSDIGTKR